MSNGLKERQVGNVRRRPGNSRTESWTEGRAAWGTDVWQPASPATLDQGLGTLNPAAVPTTAFLHCQQPTSGSASSGAAFDLPTIAAQAVPATVQVLTAHGAGSGFLAHPNGLVVTARHVVEEGWHSLRHVDVRLETVPGRPEVVPAVVCRSHRALDYALLWLLADGPFPTLTIGNPQALRFAEPVLAVGFPVGLVNVVSAGIIANPCQRFRGVDCIQTTADIDHGNSGGPLISVTGVVGITVWGLGQVTAAKFAIPLDYLIEDIDLAIRHGRQTCLNARYCRACGAMDLTPTTWHCRTCGRDARHEE